MRKLFLVTISVLLLTGFAPWHGNTKLISNPGCDSLCQIFVGKPAGFKIELTNGTTSLVNGINPAGRYNCLHFDYNGPNCGAAFGTDADVVAEMTTNNGVPSGYVGFSTGDCSYGVDGSNNPWARCFHSGGGHFNAGEAGGTGDGAIFEFDVEAAATALLASSTPPNFSVKFETGRFKGSIVCDTTPRPAWSVQDCDLGHPGSFQLWYETNFADCGTVINGLCTSNTGSSAFAATAGSHTGFGFVCIQGTVKCTLSGYKYWEHVEGTGGNSTAFNVLTNTSFVVPGGYYTLTNLPGSPTVCPDGNIWSLDQGSNLTFYGNSITTYNQTFIANLPLGSAGIAYGEDVCIPDPLVPGSFMWVTDGSWAAGTGGFQIVELHGIGTGSYAGTHANWSSISSQFKQFGFTGRASYPGTCFDAEAAQVYITDGNHFFPINMHGQPHNVTVWTLDDDPLTLSGSTVQLNSDTHGDNYVDRCNIWPTTRPGSGGIKIGITIGHGQVLAERLN